MPENLPKLILKSGKDKALLRRHPWVFSGAVKERPQASAGDIISIRDNKDKHLAMAHIDPASKIIARVFDFSHEEFIPDDEYWTKKLNEAAHLRKNLPELSNTEAYRLIHAEGDNLPGLIIDVYNRTASVQIRTHGMLRLKSLLYSWLTDHMQMEHVFFGVKEVLGESHTGWESDKPAETTFLENDIKLIGEPEEGQKTGFFIDQRQNRLLLRKYSEGKKVLDCFCYSGGFSMNALKGNAESVNSVDLSASALELCVRNRELNTFAEDRHKVIEADCFEFLSGLKKGEFDLIVLDPPAFTKHISTVKKASRGYQTINEKAIRALPTNGLLFTFSCSQHISADLFRKIIFSAAVNTGREVRILAQLHQGADHPVSIYHPEGEYLKGLLLQII